MNGYKILKCFRKEQRVSGELHCPATGLIIVKAWFRSKNNIGWVVNDRISVLKQWTGWERKWVENHV